MAEQHQLFAVACPRCGERESFDIAGACGNNWICNRCCCEFDPETGERHRCEDYATCELNGDAE